MPEHAAGVDLAPLRSDPVDYGLFQFMVAVSAEHVPRTIHCSPCLDVPHPFRCEAFCRDCKPLALPAHVRTPRLCLQDNLWLQEVECLPKRPGSTVGLKFREEIHAAAKPGLIYGRQVVPVTHPYHAISQGMDLLGLDPAIFVLLGYFPPLLSRARNDNCDFFLKVFGRNRPLVPIANFAISA